jgi:hypothetical protein
MSAVESEPGLMTLRVAQAQPIATDIHMFELCYAAQCTRG